MPEPAPLLGLVLAGGESRRMGTDKGRLAYHGRSQRAHVAGLLAPCCEAVYVSCRPDQLPDLEPDLTPLLDPAPGLGPLAGLLAAIGHRPDAAWLVVACDMPNLTASALATLVAHRAPGYDAVAARGSDDRPGHDVSTAAAEPMLALWEPAMAGPIRQAAAEGRLSPRDLLRQARCRLVALPDTTLLDADTPEARAAFGRD